MASSRPIDYGRLLITLESEKKTLDRRVDMLVKVVMIPKHNIRSTSRWWPFGKKTETKRHEFESIKKHSKPHKKATITGHTTSIKTK